MKFLIFFVSLVGLMSKAHSYELSQCKPTDINDKARFVIRIFVQEDSNTHLISKALLQSENLSKPSRPRRFPLEILQQNDEQAQLVYANVRIDLKKIAKTAEISEDSLMLYNCAE